MLPMLTSALQETVTLLQLIIPKMFVGMFAATIIFSVPRIREAANRMTKLTSKANLKSGVAIVAFFTNKIVGMTVLAEMYKKKLIDNKEVIIASIIGMFPLGIRAIALILGPIAISSLGAKLGTIFCTLELTSRFIIMLLAVYIGRRILSGGSISYSVETSLKENLTNTLKHFLRITAILAVTIFLVSLFFNSGILKMIGASNSPSLLIAVAGASSTIAGFGTAGLFLSKGQITGSDAMLALMVGLLIHRIVEMLRLSLPLNVSLFGPGLGTRLTIVLLAVGELTCVLDIVMLLVLIHAGIV